MLAPYALGLVVLVALPALVTFALALTEYDLIRAPTFVGLDNLRELVGGRRSSARRSSTRSSSPRSPSRFGSRAALGLALLLHPRFRGAGAGARRSILPTVVPDVAYGLLWLWLLNPLYGPITSCSAGSAPPGGRRSAGLPPPQLLTHPNDARAAIILMSLFTIGEGFVLLLVTRQSLPSRALRARRDRGRDRWSVFRR